MTKTLILLALACFGVFILDLKLAFNATLKLLLMLTLVALIVFGLQPN